MAAGVLYFCGIGVFLRTPCSAKKALHLSLPPTRIIWICFSLQLSMLTDRTKLMCTPNARCRPEHSKHMKTPNDTDAHCGLRSSQSTHTYMHVRGVE